MKLKLTLFFLFFLILKSYPCECSFQSEFNSLDDLKNYEFIAHVKITNIENIKLEGSYHSMSFEIIELYKGEPLKSIIVFGSNRLLKNNYSTSCDMSEKIGDEWVIFGYKFKRSEKLLTGYCTRSKKIKDSSGYEDLSYPYPDTKTYNLNQRLKILFNKKIIVKEYDGERKEFYKNGNQQLEEFYKNKKLNGKRILWFPNGVKESTQIYKKGLKNGVFKWYSKKGNLTKIEKFKRNKKIDTTIVYYQGNKKKNVKKYYIYNKKGNLIYYVWYRPNGNAYEEFIHNSKTKINTKKFFYSSDRLNLEYKTRKGKSISEKKWNRSGILTKFKIYDKNGKLIKENSK